MYFPVNNIDINVESLSGKMPVKSSPGVRLGVMMLSSSITSSKSNSGTLTLNHKQDNISIGGTFKTHEKQE